MTSSALRPWSPLTDGVTPVIDVMSAGYVGNKLIANNNRIADSFFGKRTATVNNTVADLWDGPTEKYVFPATAQAMRVVSSSATDTSAGIGCQQLVIHYLDAAYAQKTEIVTMNGTTPVTTTATNILRINSAHAYAVGTNGVPTGNISVTNAAASVTYAYVLAGFNVSRQAVYTIPAGFDGYLTQWACSSGSAAGGKFTQITLRATTHDGVSLPGVFVIIDEVGTDDSGLVIPFVTHHHLPEMTDIKISAVSDAANAAATAIGSARLYLEQRS